MIESAEHEILNGFVLANISAGQGQNHCERDKMFHKICHTFLFAGLCGMVLCGCADAGKPSESDAAQDAAYTLNPVEIPPEEDGKGQGTAPEEAPEELPEEGAEEPSPPPQETDSPQASPGPEENAMPETLHFVDAWGEWFDTDINTELPGHNYDWQYLENTEDGISYEGDSRYYIRKGVDVSQHQGTIDWNRVKAAGYEFAILRIGYRGYGQSGALMLDYTFHDNIRAAQEAGLDVGVYIFSQAVNEAEALEEAQLVLDNLAGYELDLPVVYDPELIRDAVARTDDVTGEQFTKNTILFCQRMEEAGYQPMIYSNMVWEAFLFDMGQLTEYPIWYADYEPIPQTPYDFVFWQHSSTGRVDGISGDVDLNVQFCPRD